MRLPKAYIRLSLDCCCFMAMAPVGGQTCKAVPYVDLTTCLKSRRVLLDITALYHSFPAHNIKIVEQRPCSICHGWEITGSGDASFYLVLPRQRLGCHRVVIVATCAFTRNLKKLHYTYLTDLLS